ncbi:CBS domain-containing protein [Pedobacter sp. SYP-B3415]|uniref:CBS domain-containing protein n=1 Tax=Pedobacter sp. SYP-B3415 TaxID=2496641 RepID=UPI00101B7458|nr:CBS domain-containing protein [Pedobacter sp. SYP-B3415]
MNASEIISDAIPPLKTSDSAQKALDRMTDFKVSHMPVVNSEQFLGLLSEDDLFEVQDLDVPIGSLSLSLINPFVYQDAHVYDVVRMFHQRQLSLVPVLDMQKNYLGVVSVHAILEYVSQTYAVSEPGGIIVLGISNRSNSLSHMAQIVEADNAQILSSYVQAFPDSTRLEVTLKINKMELSSILASFERYNYEVLGVHNNSDSENGSRDRYDSLMNYLNV